VVWLKDSAIYSNRNSLCDEVLVYNLSPLVVIEVSWSDDKFPRWGLYLEEQKGAVPYARSMPVLMGRANDLVKLQRELEFPSLNSIKSHDIISQIVSPLLIHFIQQLDVSLTTATLV
jgi:hypothetical protein